MQFSIIAIAAMAATVLAAPQGQGQGGSPQGGSGQGGSPQGGSGSGKDYGGHGGVEQSQCGTGDVICCNNVHDEKDGLLDLKNVLRNGLITLVGLDDVACANPRLLDSINIGILADVRSDDDITYECKQSTYCCPYDDDSCYNTKTGQQYQKGY